MITYDAYENMIVKRLEHTDWDVSPLPSIKQLDEQSPLKPCLYVIFSGSTFEDVTNQGDFAQYEPLTFEVYMIARRRDGEKGIFAVAEEVIQRLLKWNLPDAYEKITLSSFGYVNGIQNNWQYVLKFSFPRIRIMREEKEEPAVIKQISQKMIVEVK